MDEEKRPSGEEHSFFKETIKDEKVDNKKILKACMKFAGKALIFGLLASIAFGVSKPWFDPSSNNQQITIEDQEQEENEKEEEQVEEDLTPQEQGEKNYQEMNRARNTVANTVFKSVVEIEGILDDEQWKSSSFEKTNVVSGLILAETGKEVLIYGRTNIAKGATSFKVTFNDNKTYVASLRNKEEVLGFGVYSVDKESMDETTINQITIPQLGNLAGVGRGDNIIVLGHPFGYSNGLGFGNVSSIKKVVSKYDGEFHVIATDVPAAENGTGFIANMEGEIIGMVDQQLSESPSMSLITGYGISDLKVRIEKLLNNISIPYVGVLGIDVTEEIEEKGIPKGIYVKNVAGDSPAMNAGIQPGDVITEVAGNPVATVSGYGAEIMKIEPGKAVKIEGLRKGAGEEYVDVTFTVEVGTKQ
ncbi:S1-C subfamily serine protease [Aequitasia blattaphilus]|uniref:S1C family serine protease n=1 Tax=Aequitasia blattaphilus TaxID=2949332 RepID=A0ABT1E4Y8_9FIRM|nr:S1C family serine protease [Aequitasia blattaphilus]MCP1100895.1 S1C family serine protease [Aequitasia blattaphilus]MCR8613535.1 S1C family serine protease [Aequitasia blattaphilus]